jgi:methionyl-tRNA formyltransferase
MSKIIIFTQNTMASVVATREILRKNGSQVQAVVIASQLKGESFFEQLKVAKKLIDKSSKEFFWYKIIESKLYNLLLAVHKIRRSKRYKSGKTSGIREQADKLGIPIIDCSDLSDEEFLLKIKKREPDYVLCIVAQILRKKVFEILGNKLINAHGSYLPEYRGAAQYFWYLFNGDKQYGITVHFMNSGLDTGEIIFQRRFDYDPKMSAYRLHHQLALSFGEMLNEFVERANQGSISSFPQEGSKATETRMPTKEDAKEFRRKGLKWVSVKDFFECV